MGQNLVNVAVAVGDVDQLGARHFLGGPLHCSTPSQRLARLVLAEPPLLASARVLDLLPGPRLDRECAEGLSRTIRGNRQREVRQEPVLPRVERPEAVPRLFPAELELRRVRNGKREPSVLYPLHRPGDMRSEQPVDRNLLVGEMPVERLGRRTVAHRIRKARLRIGGEAFSDGHSPPGAPLIAQIDLGKLLLNESSPFTFVHEPT